MIRGAVLAVLIAMVAGVPAAAQTTAPACAAAPALKPGIDPPSEKIPTWKARAKAVNAQLAWSKPRLAYSACKRAEIDALGRRINALASDINALVDDVNAAERRVRAARAVRNSAFRAYAEKKNRKPSDVLIAAQTAPAPQALPCPAAAPGEPAPSFPDGASASAQAMRRADEQFQAWVAPMESYAACRKLERQSLSSQFSAAKTEYDRAQADYASYRAAYNTTVARFQVAIDRYTAKISEPPAFSPAASPR